MEYKGYKIDYDKEKRTTTVTGKGIKTPKVFENYSKTYGTRIAVNFINLIIR